VHAVERPRPVRPVLAEGLAAAADEVVAGAPRVRRPDLEARRVDQAIDLPFDPFGDDAPLRDPLDALSLRVDERDVRAVEALQILVVEAGPLAELAVPRLQRFGGLPVGDERVD